MEREGNSPGKGERKLCRERRFTVKGVELLEKESKRRRKILTRTIGLFEDLLRTKDVAATKRELENLQACFNNF